ncbi:hypothetical protein D3C86_1340630 [compost metagenome]
MIEQFLPLHDCRAFCPALSPQRAILEAVCQRLPFAARQVQRVAPIAALPMQLRLLQHQRLVRDMQHVTLDDGDGALQISQLTLVSHAALLHPHHAIEQRPTGQPQQGEYRHGDDQFQQGETGLLNHLGWRSSRWPDAASVRDRPG